MATVKRHRTRVGKRNQVTIPAGMLRQLGVKPGDAVELKAEGDHVSVVKADDPVSKLMGMLWRPDLPALSDDELEAEIKRASEEGASERYLRSLPEEHRRAPGYQRPSADSDEPSHGTGSGV